jgi:hypothetical protein
VAITYLSGATAKTPGTGGHKTSVSVTLGSVVAGNLLRVAMCGFQSAARAQISDTLGTSYSQAAYVLDPAGNEFVVEWWGIAPRGGSVTVTVTPGPGYPPNGFDMSAAVLQYSIPSGGTVLSSAVVTSYGRNDAPSTGPIAYPAAPVLACASMGNIYEASAWTMGGGFTLRESVSDGTGGVFNVAMADLTEASAGPITAGATLSTADPVWWSAIGYALWWAPDHVPDPDAAQWSLDPGTPNPDAAQWALDPTVPDPDAAQWSLN